MAQEEGSSEDHTNEDPEKFQSMGMYSNPQRAYDFVKATGIDTFASFIGNLHGVYAKEIRLDLALLNQIQKALPNTFLSLHGGSGINNDDVKQAVKSNIVKVNVNSEMRIAFKMTLQETLNNSNEIAFYKLTPPAIRAVREVVEHKIMLFGSAGKA